MNKGPQITMEILSWNRITEILFLEVNKPMLSIA